jgi:methylmalonyl-CoA/ethylmalonyl-CoA epimerase
MSLPHIDHIGIIVANLDECIALFEAILGLKPCEVKQLDEVGLKIATLRTENVDIELIQYLTPGSFGEKIMGKSPGINHISVRTENTASMIKKFEQNGVPVLKGFPRKGNHGEVAFFDKRAVGNILLEVCSYVKQEKKT